MTTRIDNDGPAYPFEIENKSTEDIPDIFGGVVKAGTTRIYSGLTIRDYFAAKAMQAILGSPAPNLTSSDQEVLLRRVAGTSYSIADAMIAERNKRRGEG